MDKYDAIRLLEHLKLLHLIKNHLWMLSRRTPDSRVVCSTAVKEHLACEHVVLHELVSPWDVLSSLAPDGSFRELDANVGFVGSVAATGNAVLSDYASLLPSFDPRTDQVIVDRLLFILLFRSTRSCHLVYAVPYPHVCCDMQWKGMPTP